MKRYISAFVLCLIMVLLYQSAVYGMSTTTLKAIPALVKAGNVITVSGTSAVGAWVSIKGIDSAGNIVYFNSVLSDSTGAYSDAFKAPDMAAGTLTIIAGSGVDVATANVGIFNLPDAGSSSSSTGTSMPTPEIIITTTTSQDGKTVTYLITAAAQSKNSNTAGAAKLETNVITILADKARKSEKAGQKAIVEIKVKVPDIAGTVEVTFPRTSFDQLADTTKADLKITTGLGTITLNARAVDAISDAADKGDITVSINKVDTSALPREIQTKVGDRPVYDFSVKAGNTEISKFGGGSAQISIPYTPKLGENKNAIVIYYIDSKGKLNPVRGKYDPATGTVNFTVSHFSQYVVGYNEVKFNDVADTAWYKEAVEFVAARNITTGIGNGSFGPNNKLTRGQYIVMMMKAYDIAPDENPTNNFTDAGSTYYTKYLSTAKRLGIAGGVGNNRFAPDKEITRQEMFSLLYRTLNTLGELPEGKAGKNLTSFSGADHIAPWARESMTLFINTGTIGGSGGRLNPTKKTSRAEMAQVLYSLLGESIKLLGANTQVTPTK